MKMREVLLNPSTCPNPPPLGLADLFGAEEQEPPPRSFSPCNDYGPITAESTTESTTQVAAGRTWYRDEPGGGGINCKSSGRGWFQNEPAFFDLRLEHRESDGSSQLAPLLEFEERILLFRSDRPGAIGKIIYSSSLCDDYNDTPENKKEKYQDSSFANVGNRLVGGVVSLMEQVEVTIHAIEIKEAYRGYDLGSLLITAAVDRLSRMHRVMPENGSDCSCSKDKPDETRQRITRMLHVHLEAEEDSNRHNRLVSYYSRLGFLIKRHSKELILHIPNGNTLRRVSMDQYFQLPDNDVIRTKRNSSISIAIPWLIEHPNLRFLPILLCSSTSVRVITYANTAAADSSIPCRCSRLDHWLLLDRCDGCVCLATTHGFALTLNQLQLLSCDTQIDKDETDDEPLWFQLIRMDDVSFDSASRSQSRTKSNSFWLLRMSCGSYLACDPYRKSFICSSIPVLWRCHARSLCLVCTEDSPSTVDHYRRSYQVQTIPYIQRLQKRYSVCQLCQMTIYQALELAESLPADPFRVKWQKGDLLPSTLLELCFRTAEWIRKAGHPDWIQVLGLVYHMGRLTKMLSHEVPEYNPDDGSFDWTVPCEGRVVDYPTPSTAKWRELNEDPAYLESAGIEHCLPVNPDKAYDHACGIDDKVLLTYSSAEYMYRMLQYNDQIQLPKEALKMVRLASLVDWHTRGAYRDLVSKDDMELLPFVVEFADLVHRAFWDTISPLATAWTREDCNALWTSHYAHICAKYDMDGSLRW